MRQARWPQALRLAATLCVVWLAPNAAVATPDASTEPRGPALIDAAAADPRLAFDMRYATADNLAGRPLYPAARCLLRPAVVAKLRRAQDHLDRRNKGMRLLVKDCYRPPAAQQALYAAAVQQGRAGYVANPAGRTGSVHTYGAAVDVTLMDSDGREVDMGTPFDALDRLAQPRHETMFLRRGKLSLQQVGMRRLLRRAMKAGGFRTIRNEWWHFDSLQGVALRSRYRRLDVPLTE